MATERFRLIMAQLDFLVGDIPGNTELVISAAREARETHQADALCFPELTLSGYPPEDLLLRPSLGARIEAALARLCDAMPHDLLLILGYPRIKQGRLYNMAGIYHNGTCLFEYAKQCLPNYQVFDEKRYFAAGHEMPVFDWQGKRICLSVCEDLWEAGPIMQMAAAKPDLIINLNASPFHVDKGRVRQQLLRDRARQANAPIIYVNLIGGQDELVFDGGSMAVNASGDVVMAAPHFEPGLFPLELGWGEPLKLTPASLAPAQSREQAVYQALVLGVRDYVTKNGFPSVVLGLSGGIDSAVTLAVAVDALGAERVRAVMMPFKYTSSMSLEDAEAQANRLNVQYDVISIEPMYQAFLEALTPHFAGKSADTTEENMQARIRGVLLMSLSNKFGSLVLTTGNKSEMAVGYSTLYGDMAGGFDVLKDVPKTLVYALARYRNGVAPCIPERVITRPPSAELAPDQKDEDSLPPYDVLDQILERYIERDDSLEAIVAAGFARDDVARVIRLVDVNEYKRRQAPIGVRISERGFGRDRRYPVTSGWKMGE